MKRIVKKILPTWAVEKYQDAQFEASLPPQAKQQNRIDLEGLPILDPGCERSIQANIDWLCRAQDCSSTNDGGVARDFSLINGWAPSYPETTGYIVPTLLSEAKNRNDSALADRAARMLDWLLAIQFSEGGFQGGVVNVQQPVPVTFNTGQILLGLAAGAKYFDDERYFSATRKAADWLADTQDEDGCWRKFATPYAAFGEKAYETHVSWGLFEAERVLPGMGYGEAGLKQSKWALTKQVPNGWVRDCCLDKPEQPLAHTLGYFLRGILEAFKLSEDEIFLKSGILMADGLVKNVGSDGFFAGRHNQNWEPSVPWVCLTGSVQIAYCLFLLYEWTGKDRYADAGRALNAYVRRTIAMDGDPNRLGAVRGSFPVSGKYGQYEYLNWAAKFSIDSFRKEMEVTESQGS